MLSGSAALALRPELSLGRLVGLTQWRPLRHGGPRVSAGGPATVSAGVHGLRCPEARGRPTNPPLPRGASDTSGLWACAGSSAPAFGVSARPAGWRDGMPTT